MSSHRPLIVCSRGSALALAQSNRVVADLAHLFPQRKVELKIIKTTGDKLQIASEIPSGESLPKGLFTKELEEALLSGEADIAVHSLKDLPTELPPGLICAGTPPREDVREVLLYRDIRNSRAETTPVDWSPGQRRPFYGERGVTLEKLPAGCTVATSSPRRQAQVRSLRPDLNVVPIRGNVGTRLQKLVEQPSLDATILAAAGLIRLHFDLGPKGGLRMDHRLPATVRERLTPPPDGIQGVILETEVMLPAVGQGAVGLEIRADDSETMDVCRFLNHRNTWLAVTAERAFLQAMGGGCQSPVAAYGRVVGHQLHLSAASYRGTSPRFAEGRRPVADAVKLGQELASQLCD